MFVFGLLIGPAIGLFGGEMLFTTGTVNRWLAVAISVFVVLFLAFVGLGGLELRLGLIAGILVGLLLALTSPTMLGSAPASEAEGQPT